MADAKSDYLERKDLDHNLGTTTFARPTAVYVSLHTANPTDGATGAEVSGGSYARKVATFSTAATNAGVTTASNTAAIIWTNLPSTTLSHIGIWDAVTGGNLLYHSPLSASKSVAAGDGYTIPASQLVVSEN